jgi:hypothetical protein
MKPNAVLLPAVTAVLAAAATLTVGLPAHAAPVGECGNAQVRAAYRGGEGAMSHTYGRIVLTNVSGRACSLRGFGGLSYVGHGDGTQVGAAADREPGTRTRTIVLQPGERARSKVSETSAGAYDAATCTPVPVDGFRVFVPDARASQFVAHPTTGCAATSVHLLTHQAFRTS